MAAAEQKKSYAVVKNFTTLNTKANRTAIKDDEFSWIENVMPVGYGNLRAVPAQKAITHASANIAFANTVSTFASANINLNDYVVSFEDNGKSEYVVLLQSFVRQTKQFYNPFQQRNHKALRELLECFLDLWF